MAARTYFIASFMAFAAVILWSYQPPLFMDYPDWVYQGVLFGKILAGHPVSGYALKHYPVPNTVTTVGIGLLSLATTWSLAARLWVILYLFVACSTCLYAGKVLNVRKTAIWWILPGVLFFSRAYWLGTINFDLGLCALLLLVCTLVRGSPRSWILWCLVALCFFAHFVTYAAALLVVLLYCLQHRNWRPLWVAAATLPLAIWYAAGRATATMNESALASSPLPHLLPMILAVSAFVFFAYVRPRHAMLKMLAPSIFALSALFALIAAVTMFWSHARDVSEKPGAIHLVQDKVVTPLEFGFVNMTDLSTVPPLAVNHGGGSARYLLWAAFVCAVITGLLICITGVKSLYTVRSSFNADEGQLEFLWNFSALMTLAYLLCPPNALGVVGIDLRLAELALAMMLFLLGRHTSALLRWSIVPALVFTAVNLSQFTTWQRGVRLPVTLEGLPPPLARCCRIDPLVRLRQYEHLRTGSMHDVIFPTGIFIDQGHTSNQRSAE